MAIADAPTPVPGRASDADRERLVELLREHSVAGRLSTDTFVRRLDDALRARSVAELDAIAADVRSPGPARRALLRVVRWTSAALIDLQAAWREPRLPAIALPDDSITLGRAPDCDCLLTEPSVSRRHAELRSDGERWLLRDLGSRNGTRVNGVRVTAETEVRQGDVVAVGPVRYRLARR